MSTENTTGQAGTRKINICYVARVEGQGAINVEVSETGVAEAQFAIFEPMRFFEAFLVGRKYHEVHEISSRICGICPIAHQITALRAVENALKVDITSQTRALRRLLALSSWIQSHTLSLYFLTAPDYLGSDGAISMAKKHEDLIDQALQLKKVGNDLSEIVGGRAVHPISAVFGGFTKIPEKEDLTEVKERLAQQKAKIGSTVDLFSSFNYPEVDRDSALVAISNDEEYAVNEGRLRSNKGLDVTEKEYRKHVREKEAPYSNAKSSLINGEDFLVGPIARVSLNYEKLTVDAKKAAKQMDLHIPNCNPFMNIKARVVELIYALDECMRIIDTLRLDVREHPVQAEVKSGEGFALTEAPRGLLYHGYKLDSSGLVQKADIVPPTAHNSSNIEASLCEFASELVKKDQDLTFGCEKLVRAYDPCISCSVHVTKLRM